MESTYETTARILRSENKSDIYNFIYITKGEIAETIAEFLRDCSTTFVSDIAKKVLEGKYITEKQSWCMVFESIKINHMVESWIEKQIESMNNYQNK